MSPVHTPKFAALLLVALFLALPARADVLELQPGHPDRYTVQRGDTLWHIATTFLKSPWHWPKIWKINEQIENPHLIYPGDVILLRWVEGQPELTVLRSEKVAPPVSDQEVTIDPDVPVDKGHAFPERRAVGGRLKLRPQVRGRDRKEAIPTIPPGDIGPFLTRPLIATEDMLEDSGYVTIGLDDRLALGNLSPFYARGLKNKDHKFYVVYRKGRKLRDPHSNSILGYEAIYLGDARLERYGDPSKLVLTSAGREILAGDYLFEVDDIPPLPIYHPHAPDKKVEGAILAAQDALSEFGSLTAVAVNLGERDGMEQGHILRIWRDAGKRRDPITRRFYKLPLEESGLLMIFRTFKRVSYGLILQADQPISILDRVTTP
ncbi:MAG: LysM domain-containing protein [Gammaproteobacteria bacterium]|nr:MAG: LysM domain-containing protein [Gammaproteobacteria bacterium]